jgi:DNA invertase Pin-like site-specific DNA recombinase
MIGIYTRLSQQDEDSNSINNQLREGKAYCKKTNFIEYNEGEGVSGTKRIKDRPALINLIKDINAGKLSEVWMRKQDRLARLGITVLTFVDAIVKNNVKLTFGDKGTIDLSDPIEMFHLTIMAGVDALKPAQQSKATKRALSDNAKEGKVWGVIPYGYTNVKSFPVINEEQAKIINYIFDLYIQGNGTQLIAKILNDEGIPTKYHILEEDDSVNLSNDKFRNGVIWQSSTVYGILNNEWYIGIRTYQKIEYKVPSIITKVKWFKAQEVRKSKKHYRNEIVAKYNYLLRGIIKCEKCGRNYHGRIRIGKNDNVYLCSSKKTALTNCGNNNININKLDNFILKHLFESKDLLNHLIAIQASNSTLNTLQREEELLKEKIVKTTSKIKRYAVLLGEELEDDENIINIYKQAKETLKELKDKLTSIEINIADSINLEELNNYKKTFNSIKTLNTKDFKILHKAVHSIIENIDISSSTDVDNKKFFIIKIKYKNLNFGSEHSIWATDKSFKNITNMNSTRPATAKEIKTQKQEDIEALKFMYPDLKDTDIKPEPITDVDFKFEPISVDKNHLIDFNN